MKKTKPARETTPVDRHIHQRIEQRRQELGMSPDEIDRRAGLRKGTLLRMVRGQVGMHASQLCLIAIALKTEPAWLYEGLPQADSRPGSDDGSVPGEAEVEEFASTYMAIDDLALRRKVAELVNSVGKSKSKRY